MCSGNSPLYVSTLSDNIHTLKPMLAILSGMKRKWWQKKVDEDLKLIYIMYLICIKMCLFFKKMYHAVFTVLYVLPKIGTLF